MSFQANWEISGTDINTASKSFTQSIQASINNLKKHESELNKIFKDNIYANMIRVGVDADNFSDVFELKIDSGKVNFINTAPLITQRYFIRPAVQDTLNDIGKILLDEAKREYDNNH